MPYSFEQDLNRVLDALHIVSPMSFSFRGETIPVTAGPVQPIPGFPSHPLPQSPLVRDIQATLYGRCYAQRLEDTPATAAAAPDPQFVQRLSERNRTQARWEAGWTIYSVGGRGEVYVQKGDRQRTAIPGEYITNGVPGMPPQQGGIISVPVARESAVAQPGFYYAYGQTLGDVWDDFALLRFYFHSTAESATAVVEWVTSQFNRYQVPFRMKTLVDPSMYQRTDATVLYLSRRYHDIACRLIGAMAAEVAEQLAPSVPLFTLPLRPGVGMAEEPHTGESFGMHRSRLVAEGLADAFTLGDSSDAARRKAIAGRFVAAGCNLEAPHMSPGSSTLPNISHQVEFAHA